MKGITQATRFLRLFVLAPLILIQGCVIGSITPTSIVPYSNAQLGFQVWYPAGWQVHEGIGVIHFTPLTNDFSLVVSVDSKGNLSIQDWLNSYLDTVIRPFHPDQANKWRMIQIGNYEAVEFYEYHQVFLGLGAKLYIIDIENQGEPRNSALEAFQSFIQSFTVINSL